MNVFTKFHKSNLKIFSLLKKNLESFFEKKGRKKLWKTFDGIKFLGHSDLTSKKFFPKNPNLSQN